MDTMESDKLQKLNLRSEAAGVRHSRQWEKPESGVIEVNRDAAWDSTNLMAGIDYVAGNSMGEVIVGEGHSFHAVSALQAEAYAIRAGCCMAINHRWKGVIVEADSVEMAKLQNLRWRIPWTVKMFVDEVRQILSVGHGTHIKRQAINHDANAAADWVGSAVEEGDVSIRLGCQTPISFAFHFV